MRKSWWCVFFSKKQDVNLFVLDGRHHGPLLCKAKGDPTDLLVQYIHQCANMLARGHPGTCSFKKGTLYPVPLSFNLRNLYILFLTGAALCVVCHPWDMEKVGKAMQEADLHLHHDFFYASITFNQNPNSFQQVCSFPDLPCVFTV